MIRRNETAKSGKSNKVAKSGAASYLLIFICGAVLLSGFFFAARQHFASMDYGMKNSRLRRQIDQLQAEKQRLIHAREVSLSPTEIKRAAKKAGILDVPVAGSGVVTSADPVELKASTTSRSTSQPLVQKISAVEPVRKPITPPSKNTATQAKKLVAMR
jgi:hypothetical protein